MKFLVTGSTGLVGSQVVKDLAISSNQVYSCFNSSKPEFGIPIKMDLTNFESISKVIEQVKPDVIIHLAAMTNVDLCETQKDSALQINAKSTQIISKMSEKQRSFLVYVSTDYVFDGKNGMKKETDIPHPINHYGRSKLEGEIALQDRASSWCIARTSTPFGLHNSKKSFPLWVAENLQEKKEICVITDQFTSPTYVPNLSKMIIEITTRKLAGIIHLAGSTRTSRYEMAELVAKKLGFDTKFLKPTSIHDMNWEAKRPHDSSLDVSKANSLLQEKPFSIEKGLDSFTQEIRQVSR